MVLMYTLKNAKSKSHVLQVSVVSFIRIHMTRVLQMESCVAKARCANF